MCSGGLTECPFFLDHYISICIVGSVFVSILAIWDFTKSDVWYRSLATLAVIAIGTAIFAVVNEKFGD